MKATAVLFATTAFMLLGSVAAGANLTSLSTARGIIDVSIDSQEIVPPYTLTLKGGIRNRTRVPLKSIWVEFVYLDEGGHDIRLCDIVNDGPSLAPCSVRIEGPLAPDSFIVFQSPNDRYILLRAMTGTARRDSSGNFASRVEMKLKSALFAPQYKIEPDLKSTEAFDVLASVDPSQGVALVVKNKTAQAIEIIWDQSSYVDQDQNAHRLMHGDIAYANRERSIPNSVIPPNANLRLVVFPTDSVYQVRGEWLKSGLLGTWLDVNHEASTLIGLEGKSLRLFLRMLVAGKPTDVTSVFKITSVYF